MPVVSISRGPSGSDLAASTAVAPLDPVLAAVRERGFRIFRAVGTIVGVVSLLVLGPQLQLFRSAGASAAARGPVLLAIVFAAASWAIPARRHQVAAGPLVGAVAVVTTVVLWTIGPSLAVGALLVLVPLLATSFFGRRAAVVGGAGTALVLAVVGVGSWLLGRPGVGTVPGAALPYPIYVRLGATTFGLVVIALGIEVAALAAVETALRQAQEATERERAEQLRRTAAERALSQTKRLEAVVQLASGIAHDTRNALSVVSAGVGELRRMGQGSDKELEVLSDVECALGALAATAQQLLSLGRGQPTGVQPVVLAAVVAPLASALRRVIPPEVDVRVEDRVRVMARLDRSGLEQALLNLALNARDAMVEGGALTLRVREEARDGRALAILEVEDTGSGMDAATAARAFEPFFTTKPDGSGSGLGLFMVREFVAGAGGSVEVESELGRGTRVRLLFPAVDEPRATAAE